MLTKVIYRNLYNSIKSRRWRVMALKIMSLLNLPTYRINLDTSNTCNLRCVMCYMSLEDMHQTKSQIMPIELFESIAKQTFHKTRFLELSCGFEPFMNKKFLDYVRIARKLCPGHISICTNALLMKESTVAEIFSDHLLDEIIISMDGITESTYNQIRVNGSFAKLLSILNAIQKHKATSPHQIVVRINYTMMKNNIKELVNVYDFVKKYDIDVLQLRHAKLTLPFAHLYNNSLFFHQELYDSVITTIRKQFANDKSKTLIYPPLFSESQHNTSVANKANCAYAFFNFIISSNGDVNLCSIGNIGNFHQQSFQEMLASPSVKQIHRQLLKGDYQELCKDCYIVSDIGDVQHKNTFIQEQLVPDRLRELKITIENKPIAP
jgi:MoaA/NifB/PqqE/SkfB family radical SAM enzyme